MVGLESKAKALMDLFVSVARTNGACDDDIASELIEECGFTVDDIIQLGHGELVDALVGIERRAAQFLAGMPPFGVFRDARE